jgi:RimJ/RimL family protein N-acetyltransferase
LRIRLAADEAYAYALWVKPELRPAGIATVVMAALLEEAQTDTSLSRVYGWVDRPNRQSAVLLRMVFGFTQVQSIKRLHLARRFGRQLPFSAEPSFGPLSRRGRHAERVPAPVDPET